METDYFHYAAFNLSLILTIPVQLATAAVLSVVLLLLTSIISGAELALLSLNNIAIENIETREDRKGLILKEYIKNPDKLQLTASIFRKIAVILTILTLFPFVKSLPFIVDFNLFAVFLFALGCAFIILFFTELLPRIFSKNSEQFILFYAYLLRMFEIILSPLSLLILKLSGSHYKKFLNTKNHISIEDISNALEFTSNSPNDEENILQGLVNFGNIDVQKILKPRIDVIAVDKDTDSDLLYKVVVESGYSRIPVYSESFDDMVGILYVKDLLPYLKELNNFDWNSLIRPAYIVPETKKVKELLKEFQVQKNHMAVVVDEYGGTTGIVTLEDIIEEIVGEIADESDEDETCFYQNR
ncbi:MAG: DUF21 domain-containing protein [Bacteroidales bacterium]|nr:DUF21 domain-containing protein [Bacteroidales bacterium]